MLLGELDSKALRYLSARGHYTQALALFRARADRLGEANTLKGLGDLDRKEVQYPSAWRHYEQALTLYQAIRSRLGKAHTLLAVGRLRVLEAQYPSARGHYEQALILFRAIRHRLGEANTLYALAELTYLEGKLDQAGRLFQEAIDLYREIDSLRDEAGMKAMFAELRLDQGQPREAIRLIWETLQYFQVHDLIGDVDVTLSIIRGLATRIQDFETLWQDVTGQVLPDWLVQPSLAGLKTPPELVERLGLQQLINLLIAWIQAPHWDASREYLHAHEADLFTDEAERMLERLGHYNPGRKEFSRHLVMLKACREKGIAPAYDEFLAETQRSRRALTDEQISTILTNTAGVLGPVGEEKEVWRDQLAKLAMQAQAAGDTLTAGFAITLIRLLDEGAGAIPAITPDVPAPYREAWVALVSHLSGLSVPSEVAERHQELANLLIEWIQTPTWDASREYLCAHNRALLIDEAEMVLEMLIKSNPRSKIKINRDLLRLCREKGIEEGHRAFAAQRTGMPPELAEALNAFMGVIGASDTSQYARVVAAYPILSELPAMTALADLMKSAHRAGDSRIGLELTGGLWYLLDQYNRRHTKDIDPEGHRRFIGLHDEVLSAVPPADAGPLLNMLRASRASAYNKLGNYHIDRGEHPQAIKAYTTAIQDDSSEAMYLRNRAGTYIDMGEYEQARADIERAAKIDPEAARLAQLWCDLFRGLRDGA
jgi:tetratricopeptide (TPR) repeat protein